MLSLDRTEINALHFGSVISACSLRGDWQLACSLFLVCSEVKALCIFPQMIILCKLYIIPIMQTPYIIPIEGTAIQSPSPKH